MSLSGRSCEKATGPSGRVAFSLAVHGQVVHTALAGDDSTGWVCSDGGAACVRQCLIDATGGSARLLIFTALVGAIGQEGNFHTPPIIYVPMRVDAGARLNGST